MRNPLSPIKCILILLDGVADRAHVQLGHRTPLQAAHTPNPDHLAALGVNGLYHAARPGDDLLRKLEMAFEKLEDFDLTKVHTKAPDDTAHTKDPLKKVGVLQALDLGILPALNRVANDGQCLVVITGDDAAPSSAAMIHCGESTSLAMVGPGVWRDSVQGFDEIQCAKGALGILLGRDLFSYILSVKDRGKLRGHRDSRFDVPFSQDREPPFLFENRGRLAPWA